MNLKKVSFKNKNNEELYGIIDLPLNQEPHNFAILAHCFSCSKDLQAVTNISRALTLKGFGVLRFDFIRLGENDEVEDANFSGKVDDLIEAANFLKNSYQAPALLIGHSLSGTASVFAADLLPSVKAVALVGTPSDPLRSGNLVKSNEEEIMKTEKATINIGGRDFTINKQFLDDLQNKSLTEIVRHFKRALLILHSPQDNVAGISNAEDIYKAAFHPKSFISLDKADHLLSKKEDSEYAGNMIASWALRYINLPDQEKIHSNSQVAASLNREDMFTTHIVSGNHSFIADEPKKFGGNNFGPNPYEFLSAGLATCTAMTIQMYARRKKWEVDNVTVHIDYAKEHAVDCENCEEATSKIDTFIRKISFTGNLPDEQKKRLLEIADKCPVHKTLMSEIQIKTEEVE